MSLFDPFKMYDNSISIKSLCFSSSVFNVRYVQVLGKERSWIKTFILQSGPLHQIIFHSGKAQLSNLESYRLNSWLELQPLKRAGAGMHQFFQSTLLTFTLLNKQRKNQKALSKRDTNFYLKITVTTIIEGLHGQ